MDLEFPRGEAGEMVTGWALVYGRRKVGKTYMLERFVEWDAYLLVGIEGRIWMDGAPIDRLDSLEDMVDMVMAMLKEGKTVVVDEFQRVPLSHLERISSVHPRGRLVLSGSSLGVVGRFLDPGSPLLGRFREVRVDLVRPKDLFGAWPEGLSLDYAPYISDPWTIPLMEGENIMDDLHSLMSGTVYTVPSLVGEVFHAEDRGLSEIYQGIMGCIGSGRSRPAEIATVLYHRGVISQDSASHVSPYIQALTRMGLLKSIGVNGRKRSIYRFSSPVFSVYYYLESKYGLERGLPSLDTVRDNLTRAHSFVMEDFLVNCLAQSLGGYVTHSFEPEVDGIIVDRSGRPLAVVEVEWGKTDGKDVSSFIEKASPMKVPMYLLTKQRVEHEGVRVMAPDEMVQSFAKGI